MKTLVLLPLFAACAEPTVGVTGPFTGDVQRYVIDRFDLPMNTTAAREDGDDLDGNGTVDNQLGMVISTLAGEADLSSHAGDMRASGALVSSIAIQADDLANDPTVGVTYYGLDGDPATVMGGAFVDGRFDANLTRDTTVPGAARVRLAVFADADPAILDVLAMEVTLAPDDSGTGYTGLVRGVVRTSQAQAVADAGILQMLGDDPIDHLVFERYLDTNRDGTVTAAELANSELLSALLVPDVEMFDNGLLAPEPRDTAPDSLSLGFAIHLVPCASGSCASVPADTCHDRVTDAGETDVDCGGSCGACPTGAACTVAADCQSNACDAGACRAATCGDGVRDGFESDVDCGGGGCETCAAGRTCAIDTDCASGHCDTGIPICGA